MRKVTRGVFLSLLWSMPALLWSTSVFHWAEPDNCQWQQQQRQQLLPWEWAMLAADTLHPEFATHVCDLVCPDFQANWIALNATCGEQNGKISVYPVGYPAGTSFNYAWSGGVSTTNTAENLAPGVYDVSISVAVSGNGDFRNCDIVVHIPVSETGGPQLSVSTTPANCLTEDGKVKLNILSGTPPFKVTWNGGTLTANNLGTVQIASLAAGQYAFTVTDNNGNGCSTSIFTEVERDNSDVFTVSLSGSNPTACGMDNGSVTLTINGGYPPYQVSIGAGLFETVNSNTYTYSGLPAGFYIVSVKDAFLCETQDDIALTNQCPPSINGWSAVNAACPNGQGYLVFNGSGSATEYFQIRQKVSTWVIASVPGNQPVVVSVPYGEYKIKRLSTTDNCICEFDMAVTAPPPLEAIVNAEGGECGAGGATGYIEVESITGGTPPYNTVITNASGVVVNGAGPLAAGTYTIQITDANNCDPLITTVDLSGGGELIALSVSPEDTLICEGQSVELQAFTDPDPVPVTITWYNADWDSLGAGTSLLLTPPAGINEYRAVAVGPCNADTASAHIKVAGTGDLNVMPDDTLVCTADTVYLSVSGALSECVVWLNGMGAPVDTGAQLAVIPQPGVNTYIATLPGAEACVSPDTATIKLLLDSLAVSISPSPAK
ncbi:MAG: hypothetical protein H6564_19530, partial [Lewinellaceae bacterium]|nr:hypothetical protein [Lewinellaceae bacterium]